MLTIADGWTPIVESIQAVARIIVLILGQGAPSNHLVSGWCLRKQPSSPSRQGHWRCAASPRTLVRCRARAWGADTRGRRSSRRVRTQLGQHLDGARGRRGRHRHPVLRVHKVGLYNALAHRRRLASAALLLLIRMQHKLLFKLFFQRLHVCVDASQVRRNNLVLVPELVNFCPGLEVDSGLDWWIRLWLHLTVWHTAIRHLLVFGPVKEMDRFSLRVWVTLWDSIFFFQFSVAPSLFQGCYMWCKYNPGFRQTQHKEQLKWVEDEK